MAESAGEVRLGIDFGTSSTVAVLARPGRPSETLLFDGSPVLPSSVFAAGDRIIVGRDAERSAAADPGRFEPNPKRCVGDGLVLLGDKEYPVTEVIATVLRRVVDEAVRVAGAVPGTAVLTHPAGWRAERLGVLRLAARLAGLPAARFTPEPVAAATHFTAHLGHRFPPGATTVVYDLGGGTCDVTVVRNEDGRMEVVASGGLSDVGGVDIDHALVAHLRGVYPDDEVWARLRRPETTGDRRHRRTLWRDVKDAKELLSRESTATLFIPLLDKDVHLTREELQDLARPLLARTVELTVAVLRRANLDARDVTGLFLVGGASRMPLVSTLLLRETGVAPTVLEQPELVVAGGAIAAPTATPPTPAAEPQDPTAYVPTPPRQVIRGVAKVRTRTDPPEHVVHRPLPAYAPAAEQRPAEAARPDGPEPEARPPEPRTAVPAPVPAPAAGDLPVRRPEGAFGSVTALALYEAGHLAVATTQGIVIAEAATGRRVTVLDGHGSTPRALAWSPDGTQLASSADGDAVQVWARASWGWQVAQEMWRPGTLQRRIAGHTDQVRSLGWAGGNLAGANINSIRVWRTYDGKLKRELDFADPDSTVIPKGVRCVAWSPDGQLLATAGCQGLVKIWEVVGEEPVHVLRTDPLTIRHIAWSPDGRRVAFGDAGGDVRLWTLGATREVVLPGGHSAAVDAVAWSPDGARIAAGGVDRLIRLWDAESGEPSGELAGHTGDVTTVAWAGNGHLVSGSGDRTVRVWDVDEGREADG